MRVCLSSAVIGTMTLESCSSVIAGLVAAAGALVKLVCTKLGAKQVEQKSVVQVSTLQSADDTKSIGCNSEVEVVRRKTNCFARRPS